MSDFERVKERLDIQLVIEQSTGFAMKRHHLEECPFCGGHACFSIDREKGFYKCFQCPATGDVFTFLENYYNVDKAEALQRAADLAGVSLTEKKHRDPKLTTKERIFLSAAEYYHELAISNGGKAYYIDQRGHSEESLKAMKVGWSDGGLADHLVQKGFVPGDIKASGLAKTTSSNGSPRLVDFFAKNLAVFPHWLDGRVLHFTMKDPQKKHMYQLPAESRVKEWRFYNQGALARFSEIIVVEGENDLLSVLDAGIGHVMGLIGQPSDDQIKTLRVHCAKKHIYLWLDNDEDPEKPLTKGKGFIRKICTELSGEQNIRIITYPEEYKDPDDYLRACTGDRKREIKRLQEEAVDYLTWEIAEIAKLEGLDKRLTALEGRKVFAALAEMMEAVQLVYIEKLEAIGFTKKAIQEKIEVSHELGRALELYFHTLQNKREGDPNLVAQIVFKHLSKQGRFFRDSEHKTYLFYQHFIYEIGNNRPFNALMKRTTKLLPTKEPGRSVWESIASEAYNAGTKIDLEGWIHTDRNTDTLFINLNGVNNSILKVSKERIEEVQNGLNDDGILLRSSRKILPLNFLPDASVKEGLQALKETVFDNLPCERENRYLVLCWFMTAFLLDFAPYMALMKFSGPTNSGKTTAAKLLSLLIYGNEHLGDPSTAAMYAVSSQNPLLIVDNLESDDITKSGLKFLLLSATKGGKEKRTQGTETGTTEEIPKALVLVTAIEPFTKAELINRTYDVEYSVKFKSDDFIEDEVIREIIKKRDIILSSMIRFIQKDILPNLAKRRDYITILKKEYKGHAKNRTDEFMALLMLILEKLVKYIPYYDEKDVFYGLEEGDDDIRKAWIEYQDAKAKDTETATNSIIKMLDGLVAECLLKMKSIEKIDTVDHKDYPEEVYIYQHPEYGLEIIKTKPEVCTDEDGQEYMKTFVEFITTPKDLVMAFDRFCRNNGIRNPYSTAGVFGQRLKNDRHLFTKGNWEIISQEGHDPYWKVVKGERFWRFRKTIIR